MKTTEPISSINKRDSTEHSRGLWRLFIFFMFLMLLAYLAALLQNWRDTINDTRESLTHINSMLVQGVRSTMKTHELVLIDFGEELVARGALQHPENGLTLIQHMKSIDPEFVGFGLARPDGQLVLRSNVADSASLPNLTKMPESRDSFLECIAKDRIQLGRPYFMKALNRWVNPIRVPIHDAKGTIVAVMTADYQLDHGSTTWVNMALPPNVTTALLREDGYLQHFYPRGQRTMEQTYGVPVAFEIISQVKAQADSSGFTANYFPRLHGNFYIAYERLEEVGLLAVSFVPRNVVVDVWLEREIVPTALFLVYFLGSVWAYRRSTKQQQLAENEVAKLTNWQQTLLDSAEYSIISTDTNGVIVSFNAAAQHMLGYSPKEVVGKQTPGFFHVPEEVARRAVELSEEMGRTILPGFEVFVAKARQGKADEREWTYIRKDGSRFPTLLSVTALHSGTGEITGFMGIASNLTESKQADTELRIAATAFQSQESLIITDADNVILRINQAFTDNTGYLPEEVVGQTPRMFKSGRHDADFYQKMWEKIKRTGTWQGEIWDKRKNGEIYPKWLTISAVKGSDGVVTHYVGSHLDISERKAAEEKIQYMAFHDPLTRLPNRQLLLDRLQQALTCSTRSGRRGAILLIDLDNFKTLNDTLGHEIGDLLLQQISQRLLACVREGDTVARLGGDEFVVMLEDLSNQIIDAAKQVEVVGETILLAVNQPYLLVTHEFRITTSIGATVFSQGHQATENLLAQADIAMYHAKKRGRNNLCFFDSQMQDAINTRASIEGELHKALVNHEFHLHYQIQVDSHRRPIGAEALIRWIHPERGMVFPAQFISLAEETGLILPIGQWVLETACSQINSWQKEELTRNLVLAVNISARQFHQADIVAQVQAAVRRNDINPNLLKLELTESMLLSNSDDSVAKMKALKEIGVQLSLDDFGTGYSSLQYLKLLPLNQIKIDQSFVRDVAVDINDAAIVQAIIAMSEALGLDVIAEGVENEAQREFLDLRGCHAFQGYLFGNPVDIEQFGALLKSNN